MRKRKRPTDKEYVNAAKRMYDDEGTLEVDDGAPVSRGDDSGAYVQAWVWVGDEDTKVSSKKVRA